MEEPQEIEIDAGRILYGLSRIGYTTSSAICDIIDNAVRAQANNIHVLIKKEREDFSDRRRNNVKEYLIIDDGDGMDEKGVLEALKLGSTDAYYEINSLSKFGLGLKSAAFSQGDTLQVISSNGNSQFIKYEISLPFVVETKKYVAIKKSINEEDETLIASYLQSSKGTIIRIADIRKGNHPSVRNTKEDLKLKVGVIYYYFLKDDDINIHLFNNKIQSIDPLFIKEADENGNLDENNWEGKKVKWIEKTQELVLDDEENIHATIEITQLPYPPIFDLEIPKRRSKIRTQYLISGKNYGFYVYRNKRLIAWASSLDGMIPRDQDYYAFRGRILIDDSADDYFNIDVKKSNITLSEEAWSSISDYTQEARSKSRKAWNRANDYMKSIINEAPNEISNNIVNEFEQLELLPGDKLVNEELGLERVHQIKSDMEEKVTLMAKMMLEDEGKEIADLSEITEEDKLRAVKGGESSELSKIFRVSSVMDNLLWEPYYDTDLGNCVRINKLHRFARLIYMDNQKNEDLQIVFELMLLQFSESEIYAYKNIANYDYSQLKGILTEYRRIVSEFLANMCRKLEDELPPNYKSSIND